MKTIKKILLGIWHFPRFIACSLIKLWQHTLSFDHGPLKIFFPYGYCKFKPSCSQYTYEAIKDYGVIRGVPMGLWRILRCNPCSKGGYDPVHENHKH